MKFFEIDVVILWCLEMVISYFVILEYLDENNII